jgi:hypothetical protein
VVPQDVRNVVTFTALGEHRTQKTVTEYSYASHQILELSKAGLEQVLDTLATSLEHPQFAISLRQANGVIHEAAA